MEFPFNINNLLVDEISKVDNRLIPARSSPGSNEYREQLSVVIDHMGDASAKAQGLHGPITSGSKLKYTDHLLYIMKDREVHNGVGAAVGILKIGTKKLFVYDSHGVQHELEPMCVLDFYVHESRQRTGCGRKLFEFMLKDQNLKAAHLAIDRPSHKFSQFLQKHYHLKATIPQVNNFVVFNGFFQDRNGSSKKNIGRPPLHPYRRQNTVPANSQWYNSNSRAVSRIQSEEIENNSSDKKEALKDIHTVHRHNSDSSSPVFNESNMSASKAMYSRHALPLNPTPPLPDIGKMSTHDSQSRNVPSPPPLPRDGTPSNYQSLLNTHQDAYDRRGHLKISPITHSYGERHSSAPLALEQDFITNTRAYNGVKHTDNTVSKNVLNGYTDQKVDSRLQQNYGSHLHSTHNASGKQMKEDSNHQNSDILLPKNFTPYSNLSLPPGDPYGYRESTKKLNNTGWNVFGVPAEPKSYSAKDRWRNTRPW